MGRSVLTTTGLLLDFSGTLIDDFKPTWLSVCDILRYFDKPPITLIEFQSLFCLPFWKIFVDCGIEDIPKSYFVKLYTDFIQKYADNVSLFGEVRKFLTRHIGSNRKIGIVSQTPSEQIDYYLDKFRLGEFFSTIVSLEDCVEQKPAPLPLLVAAEKMSVDPSQSIYVGDMAEDIIAAKYARMTPIAVYRQFGSYNTRVKLLSAKPHAIISSLEELFNIAN